MVVMPAMDTLPTIRSFSIKDQVTAEADDKVTFKPKFKQLCLARAKLDKPAPLASTRVVTAPIAARLLQTRTLGSARDEPTEDGPSKNSHRHNRSRPRSGPHMAAFHGSTGTGAALYRRGLLGTSGLRFFVIFKAPRYGPADLSCGRPEGL